MRKAFVLLILVAASVAVLAQSEVAEEFLSQELENQEFENQDLDTFDDDVAIEFHGKGGGGKGKKGGKGTKGGQGKGSTANAHATGSTGKTGKTGGIVSKAATTVGSALSKVGGWLSGKKTGSASSKNGLPKPSVNPPVSMKPSSDPKKTSDKQNKKDPKQKQNQNQGQQSPNSPTSPSQSQSGGGGGGGFDLSGLIKGIGGLISGAGNALTVVGGLLAGKKPSEVIRDQTTGGDFPYFSQTDEQWSNEKIGNTALTIGNGGSVATSFAMLLRGFGVVESNPSSINRYLNKQGAYNAQGEVNWEVFKSLKFEAAGPFKDFKDVIQSMSDGNYCLLNVGQLADHWILATGIQEYNYEVMDPRDSAKKTIHSKEVSEARCFLKEELKQQ